MRNVVTFNEPKFKPLPGELTPAVINGATLPVKVEAAKRAIAACCDLSELLTWKDKLAALAAAAKMARMPEMARDVNRVHKEAIFRMGEILLQYNGSSYMQGKRGRVASERSVAARSAGIVRGTAVDAVRIAKAPNEIRERILQNDKIPANANVMARSTPRTSNVGASKKHSDIGCLIFEGFTVEEKLTRSSGSGNGMTTAARLLRGIPLDLLAELTPEEKQRAKKLVVEMQEILDEMDRRLDLPGVQ